MGETWLVVFYEMWVYVSSGLRNLKATMLLHTFSSPVLVVLEVTFWDIGVTRCREPKSLSHNIKESTFLSSTHANPPPPPRDTHTQPESDFTWVINICYAKSIKFEVSLLAQPCFSLYWWLWILLQFHLPAADEPDSANSLGILPFFFCPEYYYDAG